MTALPDDQAEMQEKGHQHDEAERLIHAIACGKLSEEAAAAAGVDAIAAAERILRRLVPAHSEPLDDLRRRRRER